MKKLKTFDGSEIQISEEEANGILQAINKNQKMVIIRCNLIAVSNIAMIINPAEIEDKDHKIGVLHDGTKVIRQFGEWFCLSGNQNEKGYYEIRPDVRYYPEVAMDTVPSVEIYNLKYKELPTEERKKAICQGKDIKRFESRTQPKSVGSLLENYK